MNLWKYHMEKDSFEMFLSTEDFIDENKLIFDLNHLNHNRSFRVFRKLFPQIFPIGIRQ